MRVTAERLDFTQYDGDGSVLYVAPVSTCAQAITSRTENVALTGCIVFSADCSSLCRSTASDKD